MDLSIHHVVIYVQDMDRAIKFYHDTLGLALGYQSDSWTVVGNPNEVYIGLHITDVNNEVKSDSTDIVFKVEDIRQSRESLINKGVIFYDNITEISPTSSFTSFRDPDGNNLSIYESQ